MLWNARIETMPREEWRRLQLERLQSSIITEPCRCGRTHRRMSRLKGRTDDMLIIRRVNVFPSEIERVILTIPDLSPHYQIVVDRTGTMVQRAVNVEVGGDFYRSVGLGEKSCPATWYQLQAGIIGLRIKEIRLAHLEVHLVRRRNRELNLPPRKGAPRLDNVDKGYSTEISILHAGNLAGKYPGCTDDSLLQALDSRAFAGRGLCDRRSRPDAKSGKGDERRDT